ncbi:MAG TPA: imelysin family protein [Bacteroidia bacterium]|nr:imelysin family protein [Bacteroidia bacterium]HNS12588.1 imelysin family protein [Bacteroidia bacterium]
MKKLSVILPVVIILLTSISCKKDKDNDPINPGLSNQEIQNNILNDFSMHIALGTYKDMENKMNAFYTACQQFDVTQDQQKLDEARTAWKNVRGVWEQSEAFLFGPVSTENIDPSIDTWPVDFLSLDSLLHTGNSFTQSFMNSLGDELKGFHPAEYILWGEDGNKSFSDFTVREREYLIALATDLQLKATILRASWDPAVSDNYFQEVITAGQATSIYSSQRAVFEEIVNAMAGICDEVANGKIYEPFAGMDPSLEESPYSNNSLTDFRSNIQGIKNVYFGNYLVDGYGLNDFISKNNLALHSSISSQIDNALHSFDGITVPFGDAIFSQRTQIQNVINQINTLQNTLESQLLPFVQQSIME